MDRSRCRREVQISVTAVRVPGRNSDVVIVVAPGDLVTGAGIWIDTKVHIELFVAARLWCEIADCN